MEEDAVVWKLVGPVLVKQDQADAAVNVDKRLEFIDAEIAKLEEVIKVIETEFDVKRGELATLQDQLEVDQQQK